MYKRQALHRAEVTAVLGLCAAVAQNEDAVLRHSVGAVSYTHLDVYKRQGADKVALTLFHGRTVVGSSVDKAVLGTDAVHAQIAAQLPAVLAVGLSLIHISLAAREVDEMTDTLGMALASIASTTDPEMFLIGGGVARAGDVLFDPLVEHFKTYAFKS